MKQLLLILIVLADAPLVALGQAPGSEQEIIRLDRELYEAGLRGDSAAFSRLTSDDYTNASSGGQIRSKAELIRNLSPARKGCGGVPAQLQLSDVKVRVYGDTAVVTGLATETSELLTDDCKPTGQQVVGTNRYINVFVNQGSGWRAVATQFTGIGIN